ncbi:short-chain dehydrogenase/reductase SDR [Shewanella denitrificans OS217]|uniref:Short-chain dehydrogenase/reductase SDR n=1 Tax=Shewanella denitrificans (strain OS217 / ATCC BAA-1090 / DSM 15013) TaxID=318161 RepID=Q12LC3_SHEDO|nr:YciK family oxidoreductase [Shewanella denitrificans]ABE55753.1 short-chain dehydrogenase/reductase SDR [Shewanella denitrificans OS217]
MLDYRAGKDLLINKTILVTGAGDGIGKAAAIEFAKFGATVILLGKTVKKLENVYDIIVNAGYPTPAIVPLDLKGATEQHYKDMADTIAEQFGHLDGLLHNASQLGALGPFEHIDLTSLEDIMKVNVTAQVLLTKALLPIMRKAPSGSIIFTSSGVGRQGKAYWGPYAFSKFATEGMMQVLAHECDGTSIRVNSINPGATRTEMRAKAYPGEDPMSLKAAEDIMPTYLFLMGEDSVNTNGAQLNAQ